MFKHMRIFAVGLLAAMIFAGNSLSGSSLKTTINLDFPKLAEGKKAIEEDKKLGIVFENSEDGIVLKEFPKDSNIKNYKIPYGVTKIGFHAFDGCTNLTSVTIPDSVTEIGFRAFFFCTNLTSVTIPDSVTYIVDGTFEGCTNLSSLTIPDTIESMPYSAFDNIKEVIAAQKNPNFYFDDRRVLFNKKTKSLLAAPSNLTGNYVIPNSVTKIGSDAFCDCTKLTSVTIPDSVTKIGFGAFIGCTNLSSVTIPDSVTEIESHAFYRCTYLTSVTIPDSVTEIGDYAFGYCTNLTSVTIPDSVTEIGVHAFWSCDNLTSITLPRRFKGQKESLGIHENCKVTYR